MSKDMRTFKGLLTGLERAWLIQMENAKSQMDNLESIRSQKRFGALIQGDVALRYQIAKWHYDRARYALLGGGMHSGSYYTNDGFVDIDVDAQNIKMLRDSRRRAVAAKKKLRQKIALGEDNE